MRKWRKMKKEMKKRFLVERAEFINSCDPNGSLSKQVNGCGGMRERAQQSGQRQCRMDVSGRSQALITKMILHIDNDIVKIGQCSPKRMKGGVRLWAEN